MRRRPRPADDEGAAIYISSHAGTEPASFPWSAIADALALSQSLERLFHGHQRCCLDRPERAACRDGENDAGHRDVVGRLEDRIAVVLAEAVPEAVQRPAD